MTGNPTALIIEHLTRDPAVLRVAERRLTLTDNPTDLRDRVARAMQWRQRRGYGVIRSERFICTHARLGPLRRALVQWAAQHAPRDVSGFHGLLIWALARVDWLAVMRCVAVAPEQSVSRSALAPRLAGCA
ncbi:MAG: hypothetical protein ACR2M3_11950 [Thermomicrobiales bacterium]